VAETHENPEVTIVIPAYNESEAIITVIRKVRETMDKTAYTYEILVVDDGSTDHTGDLAEREGSRVIHHPQNRGTGAAIKTGFRAASSDYVAIIDADGSYPAESIPDLLEHVKDYPQVIGARTVEKGTKRFLRSFMKNIIRMFATFLAGTKIPDLNSGLKAFQRKEAIPFFHLCPDGFSFVSSMTLAFLTNGLPVKFVPITYRKRIGRSKFRPILDTYRYLLTVIRIVTYFAPLNVFMPLCLVMVGAGIFKGVLDFFWTGTLQESDILLVVVGFLVGVLGVLADLIVAHSKREREHV
jgi:glycosyltransferase involved in cell wall biosynthesis